MLLVFGDASGYWVVYRGMRGFVVSWICVGIAFTSVVVVDVVVVGVGVVVGRVVFSVDVVAAVVVIVVLTLVMVLWVAALSLLFTLFALPTPVCVCRVAVVV